MIPIIFKICHNMIQTFWLVKSHINFPSLVLRFKDHKSKKSPKIKKVTLSVPNIHPRQISITKKVKASYGDNQVEIGAIEAATGHSGQPKQEAEGEKGVEASGQGAATGFLGEKFDHDEASHMSGSRYQVLFAPELWNSPNMGEL